MKVKRARFLRGMRRSPFRCGFYIEIEDDAVGSWGCMDVEEGDRWLRSTLPVIPLDLASGKGSAQVQTWSPYNWADPWIKTGRKLDLPPCDTFKKLIGERGLMSQELVLYHLLSLSINRSYPILLLGYRIVQSCLEFDYFYVSSYSYSHFSRTSQRTYWSIYLYDDCYVN